jgi:hypothetical protein
MGGWMFTVERMEKKGVGQERIEICLGIGHDPN